MRRLSTVAAACALLAAPAAADAAKPPSRSWAEPEIRLVLARGLMGAKRATFRPDAALTRAELDDLVAGLTRSIPTTPAGAVASTPVTVSELDAKLVDALGLKDSAYRFARGARRAGLSPPSRFGTEAVARLLGLRKNHDARDDALEPAPSDPATRADAAYSAAQILRFRGYEVAAVRDAAKTFELPTLAPWEKRVLRTAVGLIGYPYVWAGTTERPAPGPAQQVRGGFDCSGFVWRVYKGEAYDGAATLTETLRGRTTYAMSGEVARAHRVAFGRLAPGDVLFFGAKQARSKPSEIDHSGIYLGGGWMIHSSRHGVALAAITSGWYRDRFAWARRPLAEAGLVPPI